MVDIVYQSGIRFVSISGHDDFKGVGKGSKPFKLKEDGVHIKTSKAQGNVTDTFKKRDIHISYEEINNVDSSKFLKAKLVFHTDSNTYKITGLSAPKGSDWTQFEGFKDLVRYVKQKANNSKKQSNRGEDSEGIDIDDLKELAEMREEGLITNEEFEEMKSELINNK